MAFILCAADASYTVRAMGTFDEIFFSGNDIGWYDPRCSTQNKAQLMQLAGKDNTERILNFFMRKGITLAQSSGIVGNMMQESGLNPAIIQGGGIADDSYTLKDGVGFGLVQWTSGGRQQRFMAHMKEMGVGVTNLSGQLEFVWKEMNESYQHTLQALKATQDPVEAAVIVHGPPSPGYEASADTPEAVRRVRGGNAQRVFDTYSDAPALGGSTAERDMTPAGEGSDADISVLMGDSGSSANKDGAKPMSCDKDGAFGGGNLEQTVGAYAHHNYRGNDTTPTKAYAEAVGRAVSEKRYVGGINRVGIDCGGFVSLAMQDSGFEKNYNASKGNTVTQTLWLEKAVKEGSWMKIDDPGAPKLSGDVAINPDHTYMYIDKTKVPGGDFETNIASASLDERAPMAGKESPTDGSFSWYRKKA